MANYLSPIGNGQQFIDSNGNPLSGALLFTYTAGSSTKRTTYTNSSGGGSHTNPIVLDVNGRPPSPIWLIGSSMYKFVLCPSNDTDPPVSPIYTWDDISGVNDTSVSVDQWVSGPTPTFVSTTSLTLVGDQTTTFHVGRRVKTTDSSGTDYATITASVYTTLTTLTLAVDGAGVLDSGLSAISYALLSSTGPSVPSVEMSGTAWTFQGTVTNEGAVTNQSTVTNQGVVTMSGKALNFAEGSDVTSAATCDIWATTGNTVHVTGSTGPITSFGTAPQAGASRWVIFDSTPTLTHSSNLKLQGSANITVEADDIAYVYADTTSQFDVTIFRASGLPTVTTGLPRMLTSGSVSAAATCPIVFPSSYSNFRRIKVLVIARPATDDTDMYLRTSSNGGSSYDSSAGNYAWTMQSVTLDGSDASNRASSDTEIEITSQAVGRAWGNAADENGMVELTFLSPSETTNKKVIGIDAHWSDPSSGLPVSLHGTGNRLATSAINACEIRFNSGNITATYEVWGY